LLCPSDHYDDERDKVVRHKTTPDVQDQDQDHSVQVTVNFCLFVCLTALSAHIGYIVP